MKPAALVRSRPLKIQDPRDFQPAALTQKARPKSLNPEFCQLKIYVPTQLKEDVQRALKGRPGDMSSLVRVLLRCWLEGARG